jgi:cell division protein FtsL
MMLPTTTDDNDDHATTTTVTTQDEAASMTTTATATTTTMRPNEEQDHYSDDNRYCHGNKFNNTNDGIMRINNIGASPVYAGTGSTVVPRHHNYQQQRQYPQQSSLPPSHPQALLQPQLHHHDDHGHHRRRHPCFVLWSKFCTFTMFCYCVQIVNCALVCALIALAVQEYPKIEALEAQVEDDQTQIAQLSQEVREKQEGQIQQLQGEVKEEQEFNFLSLAGTFTLLTCLISMFHMSSHLQKMNQPNM